MCVKTKCPDFSSVRDFFSTDEGGMFDKWIGECLAKCTRLDADAFWRMVGAACQMVDGVACAQPSIVERCGNMRTALRRFGEIASAFIAEECARAGEGDLGALYAARDRLRDAGDAFSVAVAQIVAAQKSKRGRKSKCDFKILGPFFKEAREIINRQPKCATGNEGPQRGSIRDVFALLLSKPEYEVINRSYFVIGHDGKVCESGMGNLMRAFREWKKRNGYDDEIRPKKKNGKGPRRSSARAKQVKRKM